VQLPQDWRCYPSLTLLGSSSRLPGPGNLGCRAASTAVGYEPFGALDAKFVNYGPRYDIYGLMSATIFMHTTLEEAMELADEIGDQQRAE